jgi:hypothetical protein
MVQSKILMDGMVKPPFAAVLGLACGVNAGRCLIKPMNGRASTTPAKDRYAAG